MRKLADKVERQTALLDPPALNNWVAAERVGGGRVVLRLALVPGDMDPETFGMTLVELRCGHDEWAGLPFKTVVPYRLLAPGLPREHPVLLDVPEASLPDDDGSGFSLWMVLTDDRYPGLQWVATNQVSVRRQFDGQTDQRYGKLPLLESLGPTTRTLFDRAKPIAR